MKTISKELTKTWLLEKQISICDALRDLVLFLQFEKRKKHP